MSQLRQIQLFCLSDEQKCHPDISTCLSDIAFKAVDKVVQVSICEFILCRMMHLIDVLRVFVSAEKSQCPMSIAEMCIDLPQVLRLLYAAKKRALENAGASDLFHLRARQIHHFDLIIQRDQMIQVAHFSNVFFLLTISERRCDSLFPLEVMPCSVEPACTNFPKWVKYKLSLTVSVKPERCGHEVFI